MKRTTSSFFIAVLLTAGFGVAKAQNITTIAGNGTSGYTGDGGQATAAQLSSPASMAVDNAGNIYVADNGNNVIRRIDAGTGVITTYAGNGTGGYSGDGGPATAAQLSGPWGIAMDENNNLYIADDFNSVIRKVDALGNISTVAGNGTSGFSGDSAAATTAELSCPTGVGVDSKGNIYIGDQCNNVIRMVNNAGTIYTIAGNTTAGYSGDGGPATAAEMSSPVGVTPDNDGNLYIADGDNAAIRMVNSAGTITTYAGNGSGGYSGDGGPAIAAQLSNTGGYACGLAYDTIGTLNLFIPDNTNNVVRLVNKFSGIITTIAGNGTAGYSGDGGPATAAELNTVEGVAIDVAGNIFIADMSNNVVRKVSGVPLSSKPIVNRNHFTVYPNPASGNIFVNLSTMKGNVTVQLFNVMGEEVMKRTVIGGQVITMLLGGFATGVYTMKATAENGAPVTQKVEIIN